jgi:redox-sensitive bicupin YhaK (pirin superfamily)
MYNKAILNVQPLGFMWPTVDPFLFCVHHHDRYPRGNDQLGPDASLKGRNLGQDFTLKDGWRMYHGERVPGFPAHPHRGFETVTVVMNGLVDHSDSHGAAGRYGNGDVQWMTAGSGLQHCEMFPLLQKDRDNPLELFQVWLNLPRRNKFVKPHFAMLWADTIPKHTFTGSNGKKTEIDIVAGKIENMVAPDPAPDSWAAEPENEVGIWTIKMEPHARWAIPAASAEARRMLYYYKGDEIKVAGMEISPYNAVELLPEMDVIIENGSKDGFFLLLQGIPIAEPVVQYGPFVMNTQAEIQQAFNDFRRTQFGGWPWPGFDHVHPPEKGRFARYADGTEEIK